MKRLRLSGPSTPAKKVVRRKTRSLRVPRGVGKNSVGFPKQLTIKHRYVDTFNLTSTSAISVYKFAANGLYDPDITSTGHSPQYFDNLSAIYDHYTVTRSWFTLEGYIVPGGTTGKGCVIGVYIDDDTTTVGTSYSAMCEDPTANYHVVPVGNTDPFKIRASWSATEFFGPSPLANDNLQGTSSANPSELSVYTVFLQDSQKGAVNCQFTGTVTITYEATWDELKAQVEN